MGKFAIETRGLKKNFGTTHAVAGVDLAVSAGGVYGVLGPNGAGKTTTIRCLTGLIRPSGGSARLLGARSQAELASVNEIGEVIAGKQRGRTSADEITLFKSVGVAAEDVATADLVYQRKSQH